MAAAQMHTEGRLVRDPIAQKVWESSLTEVLPSSPGGRMHRVAPEPLSHYNREELGVLGISKLGEHARTKEAAKEWTKSENVLDYRQLPETIIGEGPESSAWEASQHLPAGVTAKDLMEPRPEAGEYRRSDLARLAGIEDVDTTAKQLREAPVRQVRERFPGPMEGSEKISASLIHAMGRRMPLSDKGYPVPLPRKRPR
jgi:hypothetical protein